MNRHQQSLGVPVALSPVFLASQEVEPTVLVRLLSATCADLDACSHLRRSGESGTRRSTRTRSEQNKIRARSAYLTSSQTLRYSIRHRCIQCPSSPPRPWPPHRYRPRNPTRRQQHCLRSRRPRQDFRRRRSPESRWRWSRHRQGPEVPQAPCWQGQDARPSSSPTPRPTSRLRW